MKVIVVGSGPAGISAAKALLAKGCEVRLIDVGYELEPERAKLVNLVRQTPYQDWKPSWWEELSSGTDPDIRGLPKKLSFGSEYPFRLDENLLNVSSDGVDLLFSHAKGGLSNVWGANLFPFIASDISDWPINLSDLEPYYQKVLKFVELAAGDDDLKELFPLYSDNYATLDLSAQAKSLMADLNRRKHKLNSQNIFFGRSRLAVRVNARKELPGCIYCNKCLYGCPYNLIYSAAFTLSELERDSNFSYLQGYFVQRIEEKDSTVKLSTINLKTASPETFEAARVFLAAGAVLSSRIILESFGAYGKPLTLKESQYFLLPFLRFASSGDVTSERAHTLSQLALEVLDPDGDLKSAHLLVYTYNDLYLRALKKLSRKMLHLLDPFFKPLLSRLMVFQGYLHSDQSPEILVTLQKQSGNQKNELILEAKENPRTKAAVSRVVSKLFRNTVSLKGVPLSPMLQLGAPGKSYHVGGSLPMRENPSEFETDRLGRPSGLKRVHVVDASVFSSVPATNVTLTVMANSYRIAEQSTEL